MIAVLSKEQNSSFHPTEETRIQESPIKVAYMMSRFPKLTETFVLHEMRQLEQLGHPVEVWPLQRERTNVVHPEAQSFVERAYFTSWFSLRYLWSHLRFFSRHPMLYVGILWTLLRANWGSLWFLGGAVGFFPKAAYLAEQFQRNGVQHIHAHFASHPAMVAWVIHRLTGIPYSFTAHGSDLHRDQHMLWEKVDSAAAVIAISEDNRRMILRICGNEYATRVRIVHCGVDGKQFSRRSPHEHSPNSPRPFSIICIGTLHEVKGQKYLLEACQKLAGEGRDFVCHLVGDGEDRHTLEQFAKPLGDRVQFHGRKTGTEVRELLHAADLLVAPSVPTANGRREGIPVVLMEALSSGIPVVASDLSGIPELVRNEQTGLLAPPRDAAALAEAISRMMKDCSFRQQLADAGYQLVREEFDLTINTKVLAGIFQECARVSC